MTTYGVHTVAVTTLTDNPLPKATYQKIQDALAATARVLAACDKLEAIGIDCTERKAENEEQRITLMRLKAEYYPDRP